MISRLKGANLSLLTNAGSLAGTTAITSGLGFAYWWVAARQFPPEAVGLAAAAVSSMMLLANFGTLGSGTWLMGELPRKPGNESSLIATVLMIAGIAGAVLGIGYAVLAPQLSSELQPLGASLTNIGLFAAGVSLTTITLVLDQALIGLLRGGVQLWRNTLFAAIKLGALAAVGFLLAGGQGLTIYATWVAGTGASLIVLVTLKNVSGATVRPRLRLLRGRIRTTLSHHLLNMALQLPTLALPMTVAFVLSAEMNAYFYTTWMLAGFVFTGPFALTLALYSVGAADPAKLTHRIRFTLGISLVIGLVANTFLWVGAEPVLHLFGAAYAAQGSESLKILGLAVFGLSIKDHYVAIRRITGQLSGAVVLVTAGGLAELIMAALGATMGGLSGLAVGWMIGVYIEAILMARPVIMSAIPSAASGRDVGEHTHGELEPVSVTTL